VQAMVFIDRLINQHKMRNNPLSEVKAVVFLDSDALITVNSSMTAVVSYISKTLHWDVMSRPVAFNQDGPGYACKQAIGLGYKACLNSGTVLWFKNVISSQVLTAWWQFSAQRLDSTKFHMNWKIKVSYYSIIDRIY
jgi:hypothetical protein